MYQDKDENIIEVLEIFQILLFLVRNLLIIHAIGIHIYSKNVLCRYWLLRTVGFMAPRITQIFIPLLEVRGGGLLWGLGEQCTTLNRLLS